MGPLEIGNPESLGPQKRFSAMFKIERERAAGPTPEETSLAEDCAPGGTCSPSGSEAQRMWTPREAETVS